MKINNFKYSVSSIESTHWNSILDQFPDATIYQTEPFSRYSIGGKNLEQFLMFEKSEIVAGAIVRIKKIPMINRGAAYIRWGPLHLNNDPDILISCLKFLNHEYAEKRNLLLRIMSNKIDSVDNSYSVFQNAGFKKYVNGNDSIIIDLTNDENTLRAGLRKKWRYSLKQAENNDLSVEIGSSENHFDTFHRLYKEMHSRKKFDEFVNISSFKKINFELEDNKKLKIFICKFNSEPVSAIVLSGIGKTGIYLLGGSSNNGLKVGASYFLQWQAIIWLKENGFAFYDLGGIDKSNNPGVYTFKSGMGGREITSLGGFQACKSIASKAIVKLGEFLN